MAKINRVRLARGTKLLPEQVHGLSNTLGLQGAAHQINSGAIAMDQIEGAQGTFRINWHFPYLGADGPWSEGKPFSVPFCLPPLREFFSQSTGLHGLKEFDMSATGPQVELDEISFGFDQRAEPATILSHYSNSAANGQSGVDGKAFYGEYNAYDMNFALVEKSQKYFGNTDGGNPADRTLFSVPIKGSLLYSGETSRHNPLLMESIGQSIHPYKTYVLIISAPSMPKDAGGLLASGMSYDRTLVSVQVSLKFKMTLVPRDIQANGNTVSQNIQNMPTADNYLAVRSRTVISQDITITNPAAGDVIAADTAAGVNANTAIIDKEFRDKLKGGWTKESMACPRQALSHDGAYEVIAVPLMNNRCGGVVSDNFAEEPWADAGAAAADQELWDRRFVPIVHPFTVHHVILAWNWQNFVRPQNGAVAKVTPDQLPQSGAFKVEVGVGMLAGFRGDHQTYENVAYHSMFGPTSAVGTKYEPGANWDANLIDRVSTGSWTVERGPTGSADIVKPWEWELHYIPICARANPTNGVSSTNFYYISGQPVFVGNAWSLTTVRSLISDGGGSYGAAATGGQEQLLEVRMKISDSAGLSNANKELQSGYMGHWIYIIGKKTLV